MARVLAQNGLRLWSYNLLQVGSGLTAINLTVKKLLAKLIQFHGGEFLITVHNWIAATAVIR